MLNIYYSDIYQHFDMSNNHKNFTNYSGRHMELADHF